MSSDEPSQLYQTMTPICRYDNCPFNMYSDGICIYVCAPFTSKEQLFIYTSEPETLLWGYFVSPKEPPPPPYLLKILLFQGSRIFFIYYLHMTQLNENKLFKFIYVMYNNVYRILFMIVKE